MKVELNLSHTVLAVYMCVCVFAEGNNGVQCLLCGNRFASVKNMIKHQEKAHADEVRQHKERARAGELLVLWVCFCVCLQRQRCCRSLDKNHITLSYINITGFNFQLSAFKSFIFLQNCSVTGFFYS